MLYDNPIWQDSMKYWSRLEAIGKTLMDIPVGKWEPVKNM